MDQRRDQGGSHLNSALLSVVVPVYNEGENIEGVLRRFMGAVETRPLEILVVYDWPFGATVATVLVAIVLAVNIVSLRVLSPRGAVRTA